MNRKRILSLAAVAVVGIATLSLGAAANATPPPSDGSIQANGSIILCVRTQTTDLHYVQAPNVGATTCPTGYNTDTFPSWSKFLAAIAAIPAGPKGDTGATGATGPTGATGATGPAGTNGTNAQALPYGIALVNVSRGGATATTWGTFSTTIGSPVGDTASGTFRMSCSAAKAPCVISAQAYATVAGVKVYERLDISRQDTNGVPAGNCEYADGADNNGSSSGVLSSSAASPTSLTLGIGGTLDCGSAQTYPTNGIASEIDVPAGFYDIAATFTFSK